MSLHAWLVCLVLFVLKTGIHYVALAGLELRDPPARSLECWDDQGKRMKVKVTVSKLIWDISPTSGLVTY